MLEDNGLECVSHGSEEQADESALAQLLETTLRLGEKIGHDHPNCIGLVTQTFAEQTMAIVPVAIRLPQRARDLWRRLCEAGWAGHADAVHAARGDFQKDFER